jgi:DNA invertase Pin-like site-specific DNA recombinase
MSATSLPSPAGGLWLVYIRRSQKRAGSERVIGSAETSDETQIARCVALLPGAVRYEVISDSGGRRSGRNDRRGGWQEVIRRVEAGGVAGIAAYDIARLARNARLVLNLNHALEETDADLRIAEVPDARWKTAEGRFLLGILAHAASSKATTTPSG